jgi:ATP-binding cassette subfamily B protein
MGSKGTKRDGKPNELVFFATLWRATRTLTASWWTLLVLGGLLPAVFAVATGVLLNAVDDDASLTGPLIFVGVVFVSMQMLNPLHEAVGTNLGHRAASWMNDQLMAAATQPPGMAYL